MKAYYEIINNLVYIRQTDMESLPYKEGLLQNEFEWPFYEEHGIPLYKYENDQCVHRTVEEVQADIDAIPLPEPTEMEQLRADMDFLTMENESLQTDVEQAKADIDYLLMLTEE